MVPGLQELPAKSQSTPKVQTAKQQTSSFEVIHEAYRDKTGRVLQSTYLKTFAICARQSSNTCGEGCFFCHCPAFVQNACVDACHIVRAKVSAMSVGMRDLTLFFCSSFSLGKSCNAWPYLTGKQNQMPRQHVPTHEQPRIGWSDSSSDFTPSLSLFSLFSLSLFFFFGLLSPFGRFRSLAFFGFWRLPRPYA